MKLNVKKIRFLMVERDINTQTELARRLGISDNMVSEIMLGKSGVSLETLGKLCDVLNCTPNDILIRDTTPKAEAPMPELEPSFT